eukprot:TRINITY_DN14938_c0_g2_i2.p1 TRINITY_DN14938_c0_g2~~TRINITY_DN14938_c0_g2_i2.p1  ORF type:complete len:129 (-),score=0.50 TRINITY_DN14938_c0_g2_i2:73-459(-)
MIQDEMARAPVSCKALVFLLILAPQYVYHLIDAVELDGSFDSKLLCRPVVCMLLLESSYYPLCKDYDRRGNEICDGMCAPVSYQGLIFLSIVALWCVHHSIDVVEVPASVITLWIIDPSVSRWCACCC